MVYWYIHPKALNTYSILKFNDHLNTINLSSKFTGDTSSHQVPLLDLMIYIKDNKLPTRLYTKSRQTHVSELSFRLPILPQEIYTLLPVPQT